MLKICCVCGKIEHEGIWMTGSVTTNKIPVTHGYCPFCFQEAMAQLEQYAGVFAKKSQVSSWGDRVALCG